MTDSLRILLADDHPIFREGVRSALRAAADMAIVGEASSGEQAVSLAHELQPDLVLMDIQMVGGNGVEATRLIVADSPHIIVLILTMFEDDASVFSAMRAGARGYLLKGAGSEQLIEATRAAARGEAIFSPAIASRMMQYFQSMKSSTATALFPELTDREREILALVAQGVRNADIAERVFLSPKTVRNYISNILDKLNFADRAEAIVRAREAGMG